MVNFWWKGWCHQGKVPPCCPPIALIPPFKTIPPAWRGPHSPACTAQLSSSSSATEHQLDQSQIMPFPTLRIFPKSSLRHWNKTGNSFLMLSRSFPDSYGSLRVFVLLCSRVSSISWDTVPPNADGLEPSSGPGDPCSVSWPALQPGLLTRVEQLTWHPCPRRWASPGLKWQYFISNIPMLTGEGSADRSHHVASGWEQSGCWSVPEWWKIREGFKAS